MALIAFERPLWLLVLPLLLLLPLLPRLKFLTPRRAVNAGGTSDMADATDAPAPLADLAPFVDAPLRPYVAATALAPTAAPRRRRLLVAALIALALSGPSLRQPDSVRVPGPAFARLVVADLSPAVRLDPARLARLQHALLQGLDATPADALTGLIVYAGDAWAIAPLTSDTATLARFVPELTADVLPPAAAAGDDPVAALALARRMAAVLPSDLPRQILWLSRRPADARLPGGPEADTVVLHDLDAPPTPWTAPSAGNAAGASERSPTELTPLGPAILVAALLLWALPWPGRRTPAALAAAMLLAGPAADPAAAAMAAAPPHETAKPADDPRWQAVAAYRAGDYAAAVRLLTGRDDAVSHYNRGNALAHLGDFAAAIAAYEAALALDPSDADARHNADLLRRHLPPPGAAPKSAPGSAPPPAAAAEAARIAGQWSQGVADDPGSLLRRKLAAESARRARGGPP